MYIPKAVGLRDVAVLGKLAKITCGRSVVQFMRIPPPWISAGADLTARQKNSGMTPPPLRI